MGATFPFYRGITIKYEDSSISEKRLEAGDDDGEKKKEDIRPVSTARA